MTANEDMAREQRADENRDFVRDRVMHRYPALARSIGALLAERDEHDRECSPREPRQQRETRGSR